MNKQLLQEGARTKGRVEVDHWWDKQHSLVLRQSPRWAQFFALGLIIFGAGGIIASYIIRIDEVINVEGKLVPSTGSYDVKTPAGGMLSKVMVKDGDLVKEGQILVEFDTRQAAADLKRFKTQKKELEVSTTSQLRLLEEREKIANAKFNTNSKILSRLQILRVAGAIEENAMLSQENQLLELEGQKVVIKEQILQTKSEYIQRRDNIDSNIFKSELQLQYETVRAARDGVVFESVASAKGVLSAGQTIMKIVPQEKLKANVWITNKDIGYIKVGQKANVRVEAFDYTEFGAIKGTIESIGADVLPPDAALNTYKYPVTISLDKNNLTRENIIVPVISGMAINANIKLRDKKLISIVSDLFSDNKDAINQLRQ